MMRDLKKQNMNGALGCAGGFTLVELIVAITIMAILSTLAFISLTRYNSQARDAARGTDIKSITTVLNLNKVRNLDFPDPTDSVNITYSGATVWTQGVFGPDTTRQTGKIFGELKDPLYGNYYSYSVTNNKKEYQLGVVYENRSRSNSESLTTLNIENPFIIQETYADDAFSPLEFNPRIWLDGSDVDGDGETNDNPSNSGVVSTWVNKSSAGATNNPTVTHGSIQFSTNGLDGYPGVFISNGDGLLLNNSDISSGDIFYVVQNNDPFGNTDTNGRGLQGATKNMLIGYWEKYRYALYIDGAPSHYSNSPATKSGRADYAFIYSFHTDGINYSFRDVGSVISSGASNLIAGEEWAFNKAGESNQKADFVVSEILVFDTQLSENERQKVEGYLAHKWGQQEWLDTSHPYKNTPPEGSEPPEDPDFVPDTFTLNDVTGADIDTLYTSNSITVSGINQTVMVSVAGGEYSVNNGVFVSVPGIVHKDDIIRVRQTSSSNNSTTTSTVLNIAGVSENYDVTTFVLDDTPDDFSFNNISDADVSTPYFSNTITISGVNTDVGVSVSGSDAEYKISDGSTTDISTGGQATASHNSNSGTPEGAFDNNTSTNGWGNTNVLPAQISYDLGAGNDKLVTQYSLYRDASQSGGWYSSDSPKNWTFEGSDDGGNWDILDTQTNEYIYEEATKKQFSFSNDSYYRYYRLNISASNSSDGSDWINITEIEFLEEGGGVFTSDSGLVSNGDIVSLRMTSDDNPGNTSTASLTIGSISRDFQISTAGADTIPDAFYFDDIEDASLGTVYTSNSITIAGVNSSTPISISGVGEYRVNGGSYTSASGTVENGDIITLRQTSSSDNSQTVSSTLDIGSVSSTFNVTTPAPPADTTPDTFSFIDITGADYNAEYISNSIAVSGINQAINISISGGTYDINESKNFVSGISVVNNGDTISVKQTSSTSPSTQTDVVLNLGGETETYSVTTASADTTPDVFTLSDISGATINTTYSSNSIDVSGINQAANISISGGGEYSINGGDFTNVPALVNNGDSVTVRHEASSNWNTTISTSLSIGGVSESFQITTGAGDTTPDDFSFSSVIDANLNSQYVSNTITITGLTAPADINIIDGEYRIGSIGNFTSSSGIIENNQEITIRHVSSNSESTSVNSTITIGGIIGTYSTTTQAGEDIIDTPQEAFISNVQVSGEYNGILTHTQDGDTHYILATPSILASDISNLDLVHILEEKKLVYDGFDAIPASYTGSNLETLLGFDFNIRDPLLFSGVREDIGSFSGLKEIDEGIKSNYLNFPAYGDISRYLDDSSLSYLETIIGSIIGINPIKPFYCSDILRSNLITNIAPNASITASPSGFDSVGIDGITNGKKESSGTLDYEYHSADPNATITFEWDTPQKIGFVQIYNRTGCCSERLTGAVIKLYNSFGGLIYSHSLWDTQGDYVVGLDLEGIGHLYDVKKMTLETVGGNYLNIREVEIYLGGDVKDGVYKVDKDGLGGQSPYNVYCDMTTDGGGWTRIGENYIHNGDFHDQFHVDEHTFTGYDSANDNLIVAHVTMPPPSYLPDSFVMQHNGSVSESYPLYFPEIPGEFFAQEIRLRAWVKGTDASIFENLINYKTSPSSSSTAEYEVLETAEDGWEYQQVRIPLEGGLVDDFTWYVGGGVAGPFYFTGLDMEVFYR
ncbi:fibrinogen-like YCDxxxxGGGW domain-containing protein [Candidatus Gracilibacteria bacterium]|nr:fibrinogen-like YCDxxxxGGGW domain-containing protein [Candidatus Gracilibacteria bacterium]